MTTGSPGFFGKPGADDTRDFVVAAARRKADDHANRFGGIGGVDSQWLGAAALYGRRRERDARRCIAPRCPIRCHATAVTITSSPAGVEPRAEALRHLLNLRDRRLFFRDRADFDFGVVVLPHERKSDFADLAVFETDARHHPDPAFEKALVALDEAKAAEAVIDRLGLVDLNAERIVFRVRHHDVGARVDRGVRDLALEIEYLAAMAHVMRRHDDIGLRFQRSHVLAETLEVVRSHHVKILGGVPGRFGGSVPSL